MLKSFLLSIGVVVSVDPLETGLWAETARLRIARFTDLLSELPDKIAHQRMLVERKQEAIKNFNCLSFPRMTDSESAHQLIREALLPETERDWHTLPETKKMELCNALVNSVDKTRSKLATEEKSFVRLQSLRDWYSRIEFDLVHLTFDLSAPMIEMLTAAEEYERYQKMTKTILLTLRSFLGYVVDVAEVELPTWPMAESEPLLRDIMGQVFAEGSGEEKIDLFIRKLDAAKFMPRHEIYKMSRDILDEFKTEIRALGNRVLNLESAVLLTE